MLFSLYRVWGGGCETNAVREAPRHKTSFGDPIIDDQCRNR